MSAHAAVPAPPMGAPLTLPAGVRSIRLRHGLANVRQRPAVLEKKSAEGGIVLTAAQVQALERKQQDHEACGEIESPHPGRLGRQDTFHVGAIKGGVGRICRQTFVDARSKWATAKLHATKTPITAAEPLNDRVPPFFASREMGVIRMPADRGTECRGRMETHDYELYLAVNGIGHAKSRARHPQTNGICERFHKNILNGCYQIAFRRKL